VIGTAPTGCSSHGHVSTGGVGPHHFAKSESDTPHGWGSSNANTGEKLLIRPRRRNHEDQIATVEVEAFEKGLDKWWSGLSPALKGDIRQLVSSARAKRSDLPVSKPTTTLYFDFPHKTKTK